MIKNRLPIVVVEDNEMNQQLLRFQLKRIGFDEVVVLQNGEDAIAWLSKNECLIVLADCQMPKMDGYEMTKRIRQEEKMTGRHLSIIAITASAMDDDRARCFESGMDDYLSKPTQIATIQRILSQWIPKDDE
ncbi:response regulator [Glaciimonas sp. Gout2]|uniref:response regulator n=1 Tax=unclassified Glaciimonas TaxID=2644401 RepID=UPI002B235CFF|nr:MULTISPECIES: response regulator [unclassified Glaciimonas]MEB0010071.1 response regulator [Glaciimonas sp. Cout2]MEB0081814.1 response regulator [Glaciimonas sp. Gout2]